MTRLMNIFTGGAMAALILPLTLAAPAAAHTSDQRFDRYDLLVGVNPVQRALSGEHLQRNQLSPDRRPIWPHLYYGGTDVVELFDQLAPFSQPAGLQQN